MPAYAAFSHSTAAALHALPLPRRLSDPDADLHVSVPAGARAPGGRGTRGHEVECRPDEADARLGFLCTTPARTFCDLASELSLAELVALGDAILRRRLATRDDLTAAVERMSGRRGIRRLRRACELVDARAESPKESELRVLLMTAGYPSPEVNVEVLDRDGRFVARVDLAYPEHRIAIEYEGDHHRDRAQWQRDLARRRRLESLGWTVIEVTQSDLTGPRRLFADLTRALRAAL